MLNGLYVFSFPGFMIGSFRADGMGSITGGEEDSLVQGLLNVTGNYVVGADNRGSFTLKSSAGSLACDFVLVSNKHGVILNTDRTVDFPGTLDLQDPGAFSLSGLAANSYAFVTSSITGAFTVNASGVITSGTLGPDLALTGTIANVDANGRAVATFTTSAGTITSPLYVVDLTHLVFFNVLTNQNDTVGGDAFSRQGPFDNSAFAGPLVLTSLTGYSSTAAILTTDSSGNVTGGTEDSFQGT
jgi:hypothetical protein